MPVVGPGKAIKSEAPGFGCCFTRAGQGLGPPTSDSVFVIANNSIQGIINIAIMLPYFQDGL